MLGKLFEPGELQLDFNDACLGPLTEDNSNFIDAFHLSDKGAKEVVKRLSELAHQTLENQPIHPTCAKPVQRALAAREDPRSATYLVNRAAGLAQGGRYDLAAASIEAAMKVTSDEREIARLKELLVAYETAPAKFRVASLVEFHRGFRERERGHLDKAEALIRHAYELEIAEPNPKPEILEVIYQNLGAFLAVKGKYSEALDFFKKALELGPTHGANYDNLGLVAASTGDMAGALKYFTEACRRGYLPPDDSYISIAEKLLDSDQREGAIALSSWLHHSLITHQKWDRAKSIQERLRAHGVENLHRFLSPIADAEPAPN
jgi:tetratricopeptide (TPR) repeat protein